MFSKQNITLYRKTVDDVYRVAWEYWSNTEIELYDAEEAMGIRKNISTWYKDEKESTNQGGRFLCF